MAPLLLSLSLSLSIIVTCSTYVLLLVCMLTPSASSCGTPWRTVVTGCLKKTNQVKAKKKKCYVALTRPKFKNWVGRSGFFFFFFLRTVRELSFPIFFLKFLNGENSGGMQSKRIYKSCKCFFKPLSTNFCKFFAQIWHKKKKKKKKRPCFFAFYGRSGEGNITIFFFGLTFFYFSIFIWIIYSLKIITDNHFVFAIEKDTG